MTTGAAVIFFRFMEFLGEGEPEEALGGSSSDVKPNCTLEIPGAPKTQILLS